MDEVFEAAIPFEIFPSADGTSAFIRPESGRVERDQRYRFQWEFSLEKDGLPTLSKWGDDSPEIAQIEFTPAATVARGPSL
ncbi:MAG: hypothetical protein JSV88_06765 [Candidatus Aminicenantes bacterium]|nr:MAG: hypothetical protein JSV88_06765 [Candidatus Aminicenantes bacterium]